MGDIGFYVIHEIQNYLEVRKSEDGKSERLFKKMKNSFRLPDFTDFRTSNLYLKYGMGLAKNRNRATERYTRLS